MFQFDPDQRFGRDNRIRNHQEFQEIYEKGAKIVTPFFVLYFTRGTQTQHRLGVAVSRKIGGAVVRNRIKRLFREVFRKNRPLGIPAIDMVWNARRAAPAASGEDLEREFRRALEKIGESWTE